MALNLTRPHLYQRSKNLVHALQSLLIFVAWCLTIAIITQIPRSDPRVLYYFALCLVTIPLLIYQAAFPSFVRTRHFANPYAHAMIDGLLALLWGAAWIGEAVWIEGVKGQTKLLGKVNIIFGVVICLLFVLTTVFSAYGISYYWEHGTLPGSPTRNQKASSSSSSSKDNDDERGANRLYDDKEHLTPEMQGLYPTRQDDLDDTSSTHSNDHEGTTDDVTMLAPQPSSQEAEERIPHQSQSSPPAYDLHTTTHTEFNDTYPHNPITPTPPSPQSTLIHTAYANRPPPTPFIAAPPKRVELPALRIETEADRAVGRWGGQRLEFPVGDYDYDYDK